MVTRNSFQPRKKGCSRRNRLKETTFLFNHGESAGRGFIKSAQNENNGTKSLRRRLRRMKKRHGTVSVQSALRFSSLFPLSLIPSRVCAIYNCYFSRKPLHYFVLLVRLFYRARHPMPFILSVLARSSSLCLALADGLISKCTPAKQDNTLY